MDKFDDFYTDEWVPHIKDSGGIQAQLKLLTWLVGILIMAQFATIGFVLKLLTN